MSETIRASVIHTDKLFVHKVPYEQGTGASTLTREEFDTMANRISELSNVQSKFTSNLNTCLDLHNMMGKDISEAREQTRCLLQRCEKIEAEVAGLRGDHLARRLEEVQQEAATRHDIIEQDVSDMKVTTAATTGVLEELVVSQKSFKDDIENVKKLVSWTADEVEKLSREDVN